MAITNINPDGRRLIRPFFLTPDGKNPLPTKRYYDVVTTVVTQIIFSFTVAPFILLGFSDTLTVWARVYFYTLISIAASFAVFSRNLPIRKQLVQRQAARAPPVSAAPIDDSTIEKAAREEITREKLARTNSHDSVVSTKMPLHGIADDPEAEIDEIVREVKAEFEARRRRGSIGFDVKKAVQDKLKQFKKA
jgi:lysophospholipid acyltransferase